MTLVPRALAVPVPAAGPGAPAVAQAADPACAIGGAGGIDANGVLAPPPDRARLPGAGGLVRGAAGRVHPRFSLPRWKAAS